MNLLVIAIFFLIIGIYFILSEIYTLKRVGNELVVVPKKIEKNTGFYKYKILMGILSIILGVFSIINNIVY